MVAAQAEIAVRHQLLDRVLDARRHSDALFSTVRADSMYERPIPERHRIIFYLGHLEAFDWNLLHENVLGLSSFHPEFDRLFAFGIDPVGGGLPADRPSDWPSQKAVHEYVAGIRATLDEKLAEGVLEPHAHTRDGFPLDTLLHVAVEHRLMHVETLAYMLHQLAPDRKIRPAADPPSLVTPPATHRMVPIPAGTATLGLARRGNSFGWDNEYEAHTVPVRAFEIDQYMVTNRQYLDFMAAGGYETRGFWSDDDWNWRSAHAVSHPVFWEDAGGRWLYRTMFEKTPLPLDWPAYVSHAEATAYARWAKKSLPTEQEWQRAAYGTTDGSERPHPWGREAPQSSFGNFDFSRWDPAPVNAFPRSRSAFGVEGLLGNGWEWTSTVFAPFPGFEPFPFYRGYSADFFDGKHFVMKGGSARTGACMLRPTFRNWFQAHYQYAYAGFRCVNR
ncbi:MAG: SUMF1/EgtB/PvdO family nonheme iron enzyme [Candidatus Sulfotelmatobacter sp.]